MVISGGDDNDGDLTILMVMIMVIMNMVIIYKVDSTDSFEFS